MAVYLRYAERVVPRCLEELRGMAEGSALPFEVLFCLNAEEELDRRTRRACTSLAVPPEATAGGQVLLGHNEDMTPQHVEESYVVKGRPVDAPSFLAFTYSGALLHQGFNDAGIAQVGNALYPGDTKFGVPKLLAYRDVMEATTLEDAMRRCLRPERASGQNHLLADGHGEIYNLEVSGRRHAIQYAGARPLVHTNHFVDPDLEALEEEDLLNSRLRLNRVGRLLDAQRGHITVEHLKQVLSDHANYPGSVCKHADDPEGTATIAGVIIDLGAGALLVARGNPCTSDFVEFKL